MKKFSIHYFILLLISALTFSSCKDKDQDARPNTPGNNSAKSELYELMKEWYLWNDKIPAIDVSKFSSLKDVLEALKYKPMDKWSFIMDTVRFNQIFMEGAMIGYGMGMQFDAQNQMRITFVYTGSPMYRLGVGRGFKILKVNGKDVSTLFENNSLSKEMGEDKEGVQNTFQVEDLEGNVKDITVAKTLLEMKTVLHRSVIEKAGKKVGYLVFESFIEKSNAELDEAFNYFQSEGVNELVLDLRYNGGGSLKVANHLASLIGSSQTAGKKFAELTYNARHQKKNQEFILENSSVNLKLDKLFVITTKSSASASEAIINGLKPFLPVYVIGDDTHGKPVGMNIFVIDRYAVAPITFRVVNASGESDYFSGIKANVYTPDNLTFDFGNEKEDCFSQALYFIENGSFFNPNARSASDMPVKRLELTGFRAEIGAF